MGGSPSVWFELATMRDGIDDNLSLSSQTIHSIQMAQGAVVGVGIVLAVGCERPEESEDDPGRICRTDFLEQNAAAAGQPTFDLWTKESRK